MVELKNKKFDISDYIGFARYYMSLYLIETYDEMNSIDFKHLSSEFGVNQTKSSLGRLNYYLKPHISSKDILVIYLLLNDRELYLGAITFKNDHSEDSPSFNINVPIAYINRRTFNAIEHMYWNKPKEYENGIYYMDKVSTLLTGKSMFVDSAHRVSDDNPFNIGPFTFTVNCSLFVADNILKLHYMMTINKNDLKNKSQLYLGAFCSRKAKTEIENYLSDNFTYPMFQKKFSKLTQKEYLLVQMAI